MQVSIGYAEKALRSLGEYVHSVTEVELVPRRVRVVAAAADFRVSSAIKAPHTRNWLDTTLGSIVSMIASKHGLEAAVDPALAGERIAELPQTAESDLHLLRRLARHYDASAKIASGRVVFARAGAGRAVSGASLPVVVIGPETTPGLVRAAVTHRDRSRYAAVRADWHDAAAAKREHVFAGSGEPVYSIRKPFPTRVEAEAAARSKLLELTRSTSGLEARLEGDPSIAAGGSARTDGWGGGLDGDWVIVRAVHAITPAEGYTTDITAERPN